MLLQSIHLNLIHTLHVHNNIIILVNICKVFIDKKKIVHKIILIDYSVKTHLVLIVYVIKVKTKYYNNTF